MNRLRTASLVTIAMFLALSFVAVAAHADEFNQSMKLTFSEPITIPDQVLPAGTYWFILPDHGNGPQNVIQVFDKDRTKVIATLQVGNDQVSKSSGHVMLTLADRRPKPQALLTLTYPGRIEGHMFEVAYPKQQRDSFSEYPRVTMKVGQNGVIETAENTEH